MKTDPLEEIRGLLTRDLVNIGGLPERMAAPIAEFAAVSVALHFARSRVNFPEACVAAYRDRKMREIHRRALADINEIQALTTLSKAQIYRILSRKVR